VDVGGRRYRPLPHTWMRLPVPATTASSPCARPNPKPRFEWVQTHPLCRGHDDVGAGDRGFLPLACGRGSLHPPPSAAATSPSRRYFAVGRPRPPHRRARLTLVALHLFVDVGGGEAPPLTAFMTPVPYRPSRSDSRFTPPLTGAVQGGP
jgi:hypothetical protein